MVFEVLQGGGGLCCYLPSGAPGETPTGLHTCMGTHSNTPGLTPGLAPFDRPPLSLSLTHAHTHARAGNKHTPVLHPPPPQLRPCPSAGPPLHCECGGGGSRQACTRCVCGGHEVRMGSLFVCGVCADTDTRAGVWGRAGEGGVCKGT